MKKRIISAMLITAMAAAMTAGCGTKEEAPATETAAESGTEEAVKLEDDTDAPESEAAGTEKSGDTFTVGFDQDFPPMGFVGEDGEFTGFDLELAAEVAKRLDKEIVYQPIAWDAKDMELESGTIDWIWN